MSNPNDNSTRSFAPVLISVYNRRKHLEECIEALKKNAEASETELYIVSDGWQNEGHRESVERIRKYINSISGFKKVHTRFREKNWGMRASAMDAFKWVFSEHDRLIRMEDDIISSSFYLEYLNGGLSRFESAEHIFCICAHTHPKFEVPNSYPHETYLWKSFSPWGFGIWRDRWNAFSEQTNDEPALLNDRKAWKDFQKIRPRMDTKKTYVQGRIHNDGRYNVHMFLNGLYALFPVRNLTTNAGMDGSGTNCARGWTYGQQTHSESPIQINEHVMPNSTIEKQLYLIHFSFINHGIGKILRSIGLFDPLYACYRKMVSKNV